MAFQHNSYVGHYSKTSTEIPGIYNGMRVEVLNQGNELLFVADAQVHSAQILELVRTSELLGGEVTEGQQVSIRGFNAYQNCGIHLDGHLSRLASGLDTAWLVKDLDLKGRDSGRSFTRRPINAQAWVCPLGEGEENWLECKVVNASAGGVCFRTPEPLESGAKLNIRFRLRRDMKLPPLHIAVRRVTDKGEVFEYGCEFVDITPEVDGLIAKTIIQLQIMQH